MDTPDQNYPQDEKDAQRTAQVSKGCGQEELTNSGSDGEGWSLHQLVACALLLAILAMLAMLWVRERGARARAEANAATFKMQRDQLIKTQSVALPIEMLVGKNPHKLTEKDVVGAGTCVIDGRKLPVKFISAWPASQVGLKIGDVVAVVADSQERHIASTSPAGD